MENKNFKFFNDKKTYIQLIGVIFSALIYAIAMNFFVTNGNLFPGGFSGISRIIIETFDKYFHIRISFGILYFSLNLFPTFLVYKYVGHKFTFFSFIHFTLVSLFTLAIPKYHLTDDLMLIAVFGGIIAGFAISIALKSNASSGGTDFIAMFASCKYNASIWQHIMVGNFIILFFAGLMFGWDKALYSIIYQFCNTQVIKTLYNRYKYRTLHIFTEHGQEVASSIFSTVRHGITKIDAQGLYFNKPKSYLYLTVNAYQIRDVVTAIKKVDPNAFINITITERIVGNYYQQPLD